jgi:hypothetical protein
MIDRPPNHEAVPTPGVRLPEHVVYRSFEAETVLLNLRTGEYYGLNPSGARMFELLCETGSTEAAACEAADEFGQPITVIAEDMDQLCADLVTRNLIEVDGRTS